MQFVAPRACEALLHDVLVIGAGAAGLAATEDLLHAGLDVVCLEARDRIGGRIYTIDDPQAPVPIELGAEFIHGRSPEIWNLVRQNVLPVYEITEEAVRLERGEVLQDEHAWEQVEVISGAMEEAAGNGPDMPFSQFLDTRNDPEHARRAATSFVEGFNAARAGEIGIAALARDRRAGALIDCKRNFRFATGYRSLLQAWGDAAKHVQLSHAVASIEWQPGGVHAETLQGVFDARCAIITLPLGVLHAGAVTFRPEPVRQLEAARRLRFGHVIRIVFRWQEPWWEQKHILDARLDDAGFWLSDEQRFPVWWTIMPMRTPLLTAWSAGPHTDALLECSKEQLIAMAVDDLASITGVSRKFLEQNMAAAHVHNWSLDPWTRGAYSYIPAGALDAPGLLAEPVDDTLYFAGEATEYEGHGSTVHGAIATGRRAAQAILARRGSWS